MEKPGSNLLNPNPGRKSKEWHHIKVPRKKKFKHATSSKNRSYSLLGSERCYSCELLARGTKMNPSPYTQTLSPNAGFHRVCPNRKISKCCSSIMTLGHTQVGAPKMPSQILDGECCCIHSTVPTLRHQIIGHLVLGQNACEDTFYANDKVLKQDVDHGCRRGRVPLLGRNTCSCSKVEQECQQRRRLRGGTRPSAMM